MKTIILLFLLVSNAALVWAQNTYSIKGVVQDSVSRQNLDYITVGLKTEKNEPLRSFLSGQDGSFAFSKVNAGKYQVHLISTGYKTRVINLDLQADTDLGTIQLSSQALSLSAVTVTADKPLVKMDVDKLSYDLQADPESKANSVLDMMRKVPMLTLDNEDNVLLKGSGQYRIMINGRPSAMLEKSPKDILRSMPASTIQSIEVITNPPG